MNRKPIHWQYFENRTNYDCLSDLLERIKQCIHDNESVDALALIHRAANLVSNAKAENKRYYYEIMEEVGAKLS